MEKIKVGFIGCGNMGGALALAVSKAQGSEILLTDALCEKAEAMAQKTGGKVVTTEDVAKTAKYIFLGVKPQVLASVLEEIAPILKSRQDDFCLVSMAAGVKIQKIIDDIQKNS